MKTIEIQAVSFLRRCIASYVRGNRRANAHSNVVTGRVEGGSLW